MKLSKAEEQSNPRGSRVEAFRELADSDAFGSTIDIEEGVSMPTQQETGNARFPRNGWLLSAPFRRNS